MPAIVWRAAAVVAGHNTVASAKIDEMVGAMNEHLITPNAADQPGLSVSDVRVHLFTSALPAKIGWVRRRDTAIVSLHSNSM